MSPIITYNGTIYPCTFEIDCPGNANCYYIDKSNPTQGYCSCNVEQGTKGLLCDEINPLGYGRLAILSLGVAFAIIVFFFIGFLLFKLIKVKKMTVFDVRITSLLMCNISLFFLCCYNGIVMYWVFDPNVPYLSDKYIGKKRRNLNGLVTAAMAIGLFFYISASLNISILWLEVAIASKKFRRINRPQLSKKYRYAVFYLDFVFALIMGFTSWFAVVYTPLAAVGIFTVIIALYIYSACEIAKVMDQSYQEPQGVSPNHSTKTKGINQALLLIRRFAVQYVVLILLWIIFLLMGAIPYEGTYYRAWKEGEYPYYLLFLDMAFLFVIAGNVAIVKYVRDSTNKTIPKSGTPIDANNKKSSATTGPTAGVVVPEFNTDQANPQ